MKTNKIFKDQFEFLLTVEDRWNSKFRFGVFLLVLRVNGTKIRNAPSHLLYEFKTRAEAQSKVDDIMEDYIHNRNNWEKQIIPMKRR